MRLHDRKREGERWRRGRPSVVQLLTHYVKFRFVKLYATPAKHGVAAPRRRMAAASASVRISEVSISKCD